MVQSCHAGPWHDEELPTAQACQGTPTPPHPPFGRLAVFRPDMREPADQRQQSSPPPGTSFQSLQHFWVVSDLSFHHHDGWESVSPCRPRPQQDSASATQP